VTGTMPEMMVCEKMHARIPVATCVGRQTKGIKTGGGDARTSYNFIPYECRDCEAGRAALAGNPPKIKEEEPMSVTRACANCGRVLSIVGEDCCFVCYHAGKGLEGDAKTAALAAIKAKIESGGLKRGGNGGRGKVRPKVRAIAPEGTAAAREVRTGVASESPAAPSGGETKKMSPAKISEVKTHIKALGEKIGRARAPENVPVISLDFIEDRDRKIYDAVIAEASLRRRVPEQQILYMLQDWFDTAAAFDSDKKNA
jgi:hypothetical protein